MLDEGNPDGSVVTFLHGITSCADTWDWAVPDLVSDHRVLRLDFRGHGYSDRAPGTYSFANCVGDAIAVLDQLVAGPSVLVGHSLGGGTAAAIAQRRPDLVTAVLLEDPAIMENAVQRVADAETNALLEGFALMRQSVPMLQATGMTADALARALAEMPGTDGRLFKESLLPDAILAMASALLRVDIAVLEPVLDGSLERAFDPHSPLPAPGIVLAGDEAEATTIVRAPEKALLAANSPHLDVRIVAGAGHLIHDAIGHRDVMSAALHELLAAVVDS